MLPIKLPLLFDIFILVQCQSAWYRDHIAVESAVNRAMKAGRQLKQHVRLTGLKLCDYRSAFDFKQIETNSTCWVG